MKTKEATIIKPKNISTSNTKNSFPKEKVDGFYQALNKTNMLAVVESIKKEKFKKQ
jgi:hypothetical protein